MKLNKKLYQSNLRNTPYRKELLTIFEQEKIPLTVVEIKEKIKLRGLIPNKTTLYRQIKKLVKLKILDQVMIKPGITYFEPITKHHHHFTCGNCSQIVCVTDNKLETTISRLEERFKKKGFFITDHQFSLYGFCKTCQNY